MLGVSKNLSILKKGTAGAVMYRQLSQSLGFCFVAVYQGFV